MKKILAIAALTAMASLSAMAQGTLFFANFGGGNNFPISLPGGAVAQGTNGVFVDLFYGTASNNVTTDLGLAVQIQGNGLFTSTATGNQNPVVIPTIAAGGTAFVKMYAWQGGTTAGGPGHTTQATSAIFQVVGLGGGQTPPPNIPFLVGGLTLVPIPEPSTLAFAALGLGGLLLFRRRK